MTLSVDSQTTVVSALDEAVRGALSEMLPDRTFDVQSIDPEETIGSDTCFLMINGPAFGTLGLTGTEAGLKSLARTVMEATLGADMTNVLPEEEIESLFEGSIVELCNRIGSDRCSFTNCNRTMISSSRFQRSSEAEVPAHRHTQPYAAHGEFQSTRQHSTSMSASHPPATPSANSQPSARWMICIKPPVDLAVVS